MQYSLDMSKLIPQMLDASLTTVELFFFTAVISIPLGLLVAFGRMSKCKWIKWSVMVYISIMRGTPLILQVLFLYFLPYYLFGGLFPRLLSAIIAFSLNYAAYFAEIYRAGIEGIAPGQWEAAKVVGFSRGQTFLRIILPQMVKRVLPPMANEFMTLVKDTALASTIGVMELFRIAKNAQSTFFSSMPLLVAGIFYYIMNYVISFFFQLAEKRLSYYK
ncbi:MAG: amino acid ABC transporter permease [Christensenellales bacterium]|jgi:polar amino acid transport system permease protein